MTAVRLPAWSLRTLAAVLRLCGGDPAARGGHPPELLQRTLFRRIYRPRRSVALARLNGIRLLFPTAFFAPLALGGFDRLSTARVRSYLKPGMVAVDVGAHVGYYTLLFARLVRPAGVVHAVEPAPANLALLHANLRRLSRAAVVVHRCAAGAAAGTRDLLLTELGDTNSFFAHPLAPATHRITVPVAPLDALVSAPAHLVKIDVEGAELDVLAGMSNLLAGCPSLVLLVEWNPACLRTAGHAPEELPRALVDLGLEVTVLDEQAGMAQPVRTFLATHRVEDLPPTWFANLWASPPP